MVQGCRPQAVCEGSVWSKAVGPRQCVRGPVVQGCWPQAVFEGSGGLRLSAPGSV